MVYKIGTGKGPVGQPEQSLDERIVNAEEQLLAQQKISDESSATYRALRKKAYSFKPHLYSLLFGVGVIGYSFTVPMNRNPAFIAGSMIVAGTVVAGVSKARTLELTYDLYELQHDMCKRASEEVRFCHTRLANLRNERDENNFYVAKGNALKQ
ncbi:TPA: hypothetical protein HA251_03320 [Candidatus Woesearchaeota archaeon]|nr:hypothetical protein [Candidatus Woesearchaeota archaeon]